MKKSYIYLTMLLTVFAFASCVKEFDNEGNAPAKGTMPIEFTIADDATRTLLDLTDGKTVTWADGDQVGLMYRYSDGEAKVYPKNAFNIPYRYDAQTGKFKPVGEPAYWDEGKDKTNHNIYIYYPYTSDVIEGSAYVSIPAKQTYDATATSNPIASLGYGAQRVQNVKFGSNLTFNAISQSSSILRLNIENKMDSDVTIRKVKVSCDGKKYPVWKKIKMNMTSFHGSSESLYGPTYINEEDGSSSTVTVTVENGKVAAGESIDVRMMIFPQDYSSSTFTVTVTSDRGEHPVITFAGGNIVKGGRASKNVELQAPEYPIGSVIGGGILYKIGDNAVGYVLHPEAGLAKFATSKSEMSSALVKDENDGSVTMASLKAQSADLSSYPAAKYCADKGEGWYIPSNFEWKALFDVYTANDTEDQGAFKGELNTLDQKYLDARDTFDGYLTACGGDKLYGNSEDEEPRFWIGTIVGSGTKPRYSRVDKWTMSSVNLDKTNVTDQYKVRCIKKVILGEIDESVEQTYPAPVAGTEGEYDVYLLIGQSNMAGRGELVEGDKAEIENVFILNGEGEIVPATNPLNIYSTIRKSDSEQKMNPGASFASTIAAQTDRKVLLVVNARGGSAIAQWQKGVFTSVEVGGSSAATSLSFYNEAVTRTQQAMQYGALKGILWHQGCSDLSNANYLAELRTLVNNLRSDLGADVPFIAGQLGEWRSSAQTFNANIQTIGKYLTYSDWVSSEDCVPIVTDKSNGEPDTGDPHFDRASQILMGKRYAQKILKMVYEKDYTVE